MSGFSVRREVTLGLAVYALYLLVARHVLRRDGRARARRNAERIVALEERLGIDVEPAVQRSLLRYPRLVHGLNVGLRPLQRHAHGRLARPPVSPPRRAVPPLPAHVPARARRRATRLLAAADGAAARPRRVRRHAVRGEWARPRASGARALLQPGRGDAEPARRVRGRHRSGDRRALGLRGRGSAARAYAPLVATVVAGTGNHYVLDAVAGAALGAIARRLDVPGAG